MEVLTEQSTAKLKFLEKPIDEYTDEELEVQIDILRASRGIKSERRGRPKGSTAAKRKSTIATAEDLAD